MSVDTSKIRPIQLKDFLEAFKVVGINESLERSVHPLLILIL